MTNTTDPNRSLIELYLSGSATPEQVSTFDRLYADDASFRDLFDHLERELAPDFEAIEPVSPPPGLLDDILSEIDDATDLERSSGLAIVQSEPVAASKRGGPEPWRTISVLTSLAAATAIGFHLVPQVPAAPAGDSGPLLALMTGDEVPNLMVIVYDIDDRKVLAKLSNTAPPEDAVWQLWLVREGNEVPISLGLMEERSESGAISVSVDEDLRVGTDVLAISLEPPGGSQQAGPSGPVLYTGKVESL